MNAIFHSSKIKFFFFFEKAKNQFKVLTIVRDKKSDTIKSFKILEIFSKFSNQHFE